MTKDQLLYLRELHQKDDGTGHHMSGLVSVVFDGGVSYEMNNISPEGARHMVIWDDDNEVVSACAHNTDFFTQASQPFKIMSGVYANIHYMEGIYSMTNFIKTIEENFPMLTEDQKAIIKEWANHVRNCMQQPRPIPYYDKNAIAIPHANQHICREQAKPSTVVKTAKAADLVENLDKIDENASIMVQGSLEVPLELTKSIKLIGTPNSPASSTIKSTEDAKALTLDSFKFTGTDASIPDAEAPNKATGNIIVDSKSPILTLSKLTFEGVEETKNFYDLVKFAGEDVVIENCEFKCNGKGYNGIEQDQNGAPLKSLTLKDCTFRASDVTHNHLSLFNFAEGAIVTIDGCYFEDIMNFRVSNYLSAKNVKIIIKNTYVGGSKLQEGRIGLILFQGVANKNDDFSGITMQLINVTGYDRKAVLSDEYAGGGKTWYCYGTYQGEPTVTYR